MCFVLLIFLSLLNRFCELLSPPLFFDFWTLSFKKISVYFSSRRNGLKWMDSKQHKPRIRSCLMFFLVVGLFQTFVFEFDVMIVVNRFFSPVTCCKPVSLKNACFLEGSESQMKFLKEPLFDFSVWSNYRKQTESDKCT